MPTYSHSRLSTYEECPLKYKLGYIDKIERDIEGVEAFLGQRVHDVLKKCYDDVKLAKGNSLEDLLAYYNQVWQKNWHDAIVVTRAEVTPENYRMRGEKMLKSHYDRHAPFNSDTIIGTEVRLNFSLDENNGYRITGYVDRLSKTSDGTYQVHDYKTSSYLPGQKDADEDRQLGLYHIGIQRKWPDIQNIRLVWHYLDHDTELISYRSPEAVSRLIDSTVQLIDRIEADTEFKPRENKYCDWCEYPDLCPCRKHFYVVEALPVNEYLKEPGVVLVNRLAELKEQAEKAKEQSKRTEEEIEKVEEAIIDYARREGVNVIKGNDCKAKVTFKQKLKFPGKNDAERPALDAVIKEAGKWDEVSILDIKAIADTLDSGEWSQELIDQIMEYGCFEESTTVRLSKLREEEE